MKLRTALGAFVALLFVLFAALSLSLLRTTDLLGRSAREIALAGESIRQGEELKSRLLLHNRNAFLYALGGDPAHLQTRRSQRAEIDEILSELQRLAIDAGETRVLSTLAEELNEYFARRRALDAAGADPLEAYRQVSRYLEDAAAAANQLIRLNVDQKNHLMGVVGERNQLANRIALAMLLLGGAVLCGLLGSAYLFAARPLARLARTVESLGSGKYESRVEPSGLHKSEKSVLTSTQWPTHSSNGARTTCVS